MLSFIVAAGISFIFSYSRRSFHWHSTAAVDASTCKSEVLDDPGQDFRVGNNKNNLRNQAKAIYVSGEQQKLTVFSHFNFVSLSLFLSLSLSPFLSLFLCVSFLSPSYFR